jgi:hypothetical protein
MGVVVKKHVVKSGPRVGQWDICRAEVQCRNQGLHVTVDTLDAVRKWVAVEEGRVVDAVLLSEADVARFKAKGESFERAWVDKSGWESQVEQLISINRLHGVVSDGVYSRSGLMSEWSFKYGSYGEPGSLSTRDVNDHSGGFLTIDDVPDKSGVSNTGVFVSKVSVVSTSLDGVRKLRAAAKFLYGLGEVRRGLKVDFKVSEDEGSVSRRFVLSDVSFNADSLSAGEAFKINSFLKNNLGVESDFIPLPDGYVHGSNYGDKSFWDEGSLDVERFNGLNDGRSAHVSLVPSVFDSEGRVTREYKKYEREQVKRSRGVSGGSGDGLGLSDKVKDFFGF